MTSDELGFEGVPFIPDRNDGTPPQPSTGPANPCGTSLPAPRAQTGAPLIGDMTEAVRRAHHAVLEAQQAMQDVLLAQAESFTTTRADHPAAPAMSTGEPALMHELHMAHLADGDLCLAYGISTHCTSAQVRPRLPRGDLLMLSRSSTGVSKKADYEVGMVVETEFDVPCDAWFCHQDGSGGTPAVFFMESSLQAAAFCGVVSGVHLEYPDDDLCVRNLEGHGQVVRDMDPRGRTVRQRTTLLAHSPMPGAIIQRYGYELELDGEVFYTGETSHGYFTAPMLARQQGLDNGRRMPTWLDTQGDQDNVRRLDLGFDKRLGEGRLALLGQVDLVPDGGTHGLGYLRCTKEVRADDPLFDLHFLHDPVMPGSFGVETLHRLVRAFALYTGVTEGITAPRFTLAPGTRHHWAYRGQILRHHQESTFEIHIREARRTGKHLFLRAEGSVWCDGLRIYRVDDIVIEARPGHEDGTR
ncbi:hypothetical protein GCM10010446_25400 [Streptomyces enissocaesilis]|uniref:Trans-2-decenoyl-[acyl-carrier-protein] isomerase n=2 Tax=Streptomyces enissocaesilis TaxID=332589 RepID=A0ABN3X8F9_9ACTN